MWKKRWLHGDNQYSCRCQSCHVQGGIHQLMLQCEWPDLHCNGHESSQGQLSPTVLCCVGLHEIALSEHLGGCAVLPCAVLCQALMCCATQSCSFGPHTDLFYAITALCCVITWVSKAWLLFCHECKCCLKSVEQSLSACAVCIWCCTHLYTAT